MLLVLESETLHLIRQNFCTFTDLPGLTLVGKYVEYFKQDLGQI